MSPYFNLENPVYLDLGPGGRERARKERDRVSLCVFVCISVLRPILSICYELRGYQEEYSTDPPLRGAHGLGPEETEG